MRPRLKIPCMAAPAELPVKVSTAVMDRSPHTCFALTESLDIEYCNPAWDRFAVENGGQQGVLASHVLHTPLLQYVPGEIAPKIRRLFGTARALGVPQEQDYECSSAETFRLYRMQVYPLRSEEHTSE